MSVRILYYVFCGLLCIVTCSAEENNAAKTNCILNKYDKLQGSTVNYSFKCNVVLCGDTNVGKSSILNKWKKDIFEEKIESTTLPQIDYVVDLNRKDSNNVIKLCLHDTCTYKDFNTNPISNSDVIVFVYDITNQESFDHITQWLLDVQNIRREYEEKDIHFFLVGNKCDLNDHRKVAKETGNNFAQAHNMRFIEVSAKDGTNIEYLFKKMADELYNNYLDSGNIPRGEVLNCYDTITEKTQDNKESKHCCPCYEEDE